MKKPIHIDLTSELLTIHEAAVEARRSHWSLRRDIARRQLACIRAGKKRGRIFIARADLNAYLNRSRISAIGE